MIHVPSLSFVSRQLSADATSDPMSEQVSAAVDAAPLHSLIFIAITMLAVGSP